MVVDSAASRAAALDVWPFTESSWAGAGVVPFGEEILHRETVPVTQFDQYLSRLSAYMLDVMIARGGVGLAANQVGSSLRVFVHLHRKVAPQVVVNPRVVASSGSWPYREGCLSLKLSEAHSDLPRPQFLTVDAQTLDGESFRIECDEDVARVFQHEIDHLDGLVYVQRLRGRERRRVYAIMRANGVPVESFPPVRD